MKSLKFFKPALATTLGIVLAWLLSVQSAQAGYIVTLQQVGPNVVATGSGAFNLTGLTKLNFYWLPPISLTPKIAPSAATIRTGPFSGLDLYHTESSGPT